MLVANKVGRVECILCNILRRKSSYKPPRNLQNDPSKRAIKGENAKILKQYNKENKLLFGQLVETLPQKRKREKSEIKTVETYSSNEDDESCEVWWLTNALKTPKVRTEFDLTKTSISFEHDRSWTSVNEENITEPANINIPTNCINFPSQESSETVIVDDIDRREKTDVFHKSNVRLPQIMVKNITTFPLNNKNKETSSNISCSPAILNLPIGEESGSIRSQNTKYPSVSRILNATMSEASRAALQKWKENLIAELGEEGFQKYQQALLEHGRLFHSTVQQYLSGVTMEEIILDSAIEGCWHSLKAMMKEVTTVKVLESHVVHPELLYHGIVDCIAEYRGKLLLIEWKKSNKQKSSIWSTYDAPLQLAAYLGAMNFDGNYDLKVHGGLVVVAYTDGSPAHIHYLDSALCQKYWRMWLGRLQQYWDLINKHDMRNKVPNTLMI